jgi:thioredoxin-like negative regulator of GroEL
VSFKDIHFCKFDVDEVPAVAAELQVTAMPTFFLFINGKRVSQVVGANPKGIYDALTTASAEVTMVKDVAADAAAAGAAAGAKEAEAVGAEDKKPEEVAEAKKPEEAAAASEDQKLETERKDW